MAPRNNLNWASQRVLDKEAKSSEQPTVSLQKSCQERPEMVKLAKVLQSNIRLDLHVELKESSTEEKEITSKV